jgi:DNA-binding response OmpR family regulator
MRVLVAEDEKRIAGFIRNALKAERMLVDVVHRGDEALEQIMTQGYDAVILDIMLPGRDGLSLLREVRARRNNVPIILVTARGEPTEKIEGLNLGADDYLVKPFRTDELIARLHAVVRRATGEKMSVLSVADLTMNVLTREVHRAGRKIELPAREFALLEYFMRSAGRVLTRTHICEHVWDYHFDTQTNIVDVYVQRLRRKIDDGHDVKLLHTVRGVGYVIRMEA